MDASKRAVTKLLVLTPFELKVIQALADKYSRGNLSAWIRHASRSYKPKKGEVIR